MNKDEYKKKYEEITNWFIEETDKITEKLKKRKKIIGLDTNKEEYEPLHKEYSKRLHELKKEYENSTY